MYQDFLISHFFRDLNLMHDCHQTKAKICFVTNFALKASCWELIDLIIIEKNKIHTNTGE